MESYTYDDKYKYLLYSLLYAPIYLVNFKHIEYIAVRCFACQCNLATVRQ